MVKLTFCGTYSICLQYIGILTILSFLYIINSVVKPMCIVMENLLVILHMKLGGNKTYPLLMALFLAYTSLFPPFHLKICIRCYSNIAISEMIEIFE